MKMEYNKNFISQNLERKPTTKRPLIHCNNDASLTHSAVHDVVPAPQAGE